MDKPVLLDYNAAAAYLTLSPYTLRRLVSEGRIACTKIGAKCVRFTPQQLQDFIDRGIRPARESHR